MAHQQDGARDVQVRVLHVVGGLAAQGGVMAFAETVAASEMPGVRQAVWKHRDFAGCPGVTWVRAGVAKATDLGMRHDAIAGLGEAVALRRWLAGRRADGERWILHAHSRVGALAASLAGRAPGCRTLIHLHKLSGQPWIHRSLVHWGRAGWVFNSQRTRRHHGVEPRDCTVVYPPLRWPTEPDRKWHESDAGRLVAAGAYVRVKQFDRLLAAAGRLRGEGTGWPLEIWGRSDPPVDAEHDRELVRLAAGVPGVTLRGYDAAWAMHLKANDVFVHSADLEAYGIVILEAFARGLRVVVPRESILDELAGDWRSAGGVYVAASTRPDDLAAAMLEAMRDRGSVGERWKARVGVARSVSVEECVCQLGTLYRSLSDTNRCFRNSSRP